MVAQFMITWKPIIELEGKYEVSDNGIVRNVKTNHIKKQKLSSNKKYLQASFTKKGKSKFITIHRLMAWAFFGKQKKGIEVRHLNGDSLDNRIANLAYGSKSDNMQDSIRHGTFSMSEWHPCAKLTKEQVCEIYLSTEHYKEVAKKYKIHPFTVHKIKRRKVRKLDTEEIKNLKQKIDKKCKFNNLTEYELNIVKDKSISQRKAAQLISVPQRTIWRWRNKKI